MACANALAHLPAETPSNPQCPGLVHAAVAQQYYRVLTVRYILVTIPWYLPEYAPNNPVCYLGTPEYVYTQYTVLNMTLLILTRSVVVFCSVEPTLQGVVSHLKHPFFHSFSPCLVVFLFSFAAFFRCLPQGTRVAGTTKPAKSGAYTITDRQPTHCSFLLL